jgi:hypothetical protein
LSPDDKSRIRIKDIFNHPWFKSFEKTESDESSDDSFTYKKKEFQKKLDQKEIKNQYKTKPLVIKNMDNFNSISDSLNDKPKSNFTNYATGINSIKIKENKKVDLKKLKNSHKNSGISTNRISPNRDVEYLKRIDTSKSNIMKTIETEENEDTRNKNIIKTKKN